MVRALGVRAMNVAAATVVASEEVLPDGDHVLVRLAVSVFGCLAAILTDRCSDTRSHGAFDCQWKRWYR
jgi:hypothetical protein